MVVVVAVVLAVGGVVAVVGDVLADPPASIAASLINFSRRLAINWRMRFGASVVLSGTVVALSDESRARRMEFNSCVLRLSDRLSEAESIIFQQSNNGLLIILLSIFLLIQ